MAERSLDDITGEIVNAAYKLHCALGPELLESVCAPLGRNPSHSNMKVCVSDACRVDLLVEGRVVLKSVERLAPVHSKQLLTYLRLLGLQVGLLVNFGAATMKEGLHRVVNGLPASASSRLRVNRLPGSQIR